MRAFHASSVCRSSVSVRMSLLKSATQSCSCIHVLTFAACSMLSCTRMHHTHVQCYAAMPCVSAVYALGAQVRFVFLSATIPNSREFVGWVAGQHHQPCHVVYTNYRPTPLQHYLFPAGSDGLHLVVDEKGKFLEANFQAAMSALQVNTVTVACACVSISTLEVRVC